MKTSFIRGYVAALGDATLVPMAVRVALVVGSVLLTINHGPALVQGQMTRGRWVSALLTYSIPYAVNIHGQYVSQRRQAIAHASRVALAAAESPELLQKR